jgi:subtilisin family serine protease
VLITGISAVLSIPPVILPSVYSAAYAQDDDGDDGGSAGARSGSERRASRNPGTGLFGRYFGGSPRYKAPRQKKAARTKPVPLAQYRDREIVAIGLSQAEIDVLAGRGYAVTEQVTVATVSAQMVRLSVPQGTTLETARADVRAVNATAVADFNHFYRPQLDAGCEGEACLAWSQLQWPASATATAGCGGSVRMGMVDTAVNADHEALQSARIELIDTSAKDAGDSGAGHGTAVAALLVGARTSRTPGLLPAAQLIAADPFERTGSDERGDVYAIVASIDALASKNVHAINLSFAGPDNVLLDRISSAVSSRGIPLIAAVGNAGAGSPPLFPAAYQSAIAVTAVDRNRNIYRRAVRGDHIDFAAPGVNVWTAASVKGGRPKTGTSFATPFVTAAAALIKAGDPQATPLSIMEKLSAAASDLGEPAKDKVFGHGLIQTAGLCDPGTEPLPVSAQ